MATTKRERGSSGSRTKSGALQPLLLSIPEVCESLRLSRAKVYRLIYYEGLPVVHFGRSARVSVIALQEWLEQRAKSA
jgi:excisionase family DNA binding protein